MRPPPRRRSRARPRPARCARAPRSASRRAPDPPCIAMPPHAPRQATRRARAPSPPRGPIATPRPHRPPRPLPHAHCLMPRRLAPALTERPSRRPCQVRNIARGRSDLPNPLSGERSAGGATPMREPAQSVPASPSQQAWRTPAPTGPPSVAATAPAAVPEPVRRPRQRRYSWAGNLNLRSFKVPPQPAPLRAHCTLRARSVHARCVCTTAHPPHSRRTSATQRTA